MEKVSDTMTDYIKKLIYLFLSFFSLSFGGTLPSHIAFFPFQMEEGDRYGLHVDCSLNMLPNL